MVVVASWRGLCEPLGRLIEHYWVKESVPVLHQYGYNFEYAGERFQAKLNQTRHGYDSSGEDVWD